MPEPLKSAEGKSLEERVAEHKKLLVDAGDEIGLKAAANEGWKSQVRILLDAAREETEPAVVRNLARYQSVRNKKSWSSGHEILPDLETALQQIDSAAGTDTELAMEMIRHLLLYAMRSHTYHAKISGKAEGQVDD